MDKESAKDLREEILFSGTLLNVLLMSALIILGWVFFYVKSGFLVVLFFVPLLLLSSLALAILLLVTDEPYLEPYLTKFLAANAIGSVLIIVVCALDEEMLGASIYGCFLIVMFALFLSDTVRIWQKKPPLIRVPIWLSIALFLVSCLCFVWLLRGLL